MIRVMGDFMPLCKANYFFSFHQRAKPEGRKLVMHRCEEPKLLPQINYRVKNAGITLPSHIRKGVYSVNSALTVAERLVPSM